MFEGKECRLCRFSGCLRVWQKQLQTNPQMEAWHAHQRLLAVLLRSLLANNNNNPPLCSPHETRLWPSHWSNGSHKSLLFRYHALEEENGWMICGQSLCGDRMVIAGRLHVDRIHTPGNSWHPRASQNESLYRVTVADSSPSPVVWHQEHKPRNAVARVTHYGLCI